MASTNQNTFQAHHRLCPAQLQLPESTAVTTIQSQTFYLQFDLDLCRTLCINSFKYDVPPLDRVVSIATVAEAHGYCSVKTEKTETPVCSDYLEPVPLLVHAMSFNNLKKIKV